MRSDHVALALAVWIGGCSLIANPDDHLGGDAGAGDAGDAGPGDAGLSCGVLELSGGSANAPSRTEYSVTSFTLEAWVRPSAAGLTGAQNIVGRWGTLGTSGSYALYLADGRPSLGISCDGMDFHPLMDTATLRADRWSHVAATFDAGAARVFVDGVSVGESTFPCVDPNPLTTTPFQIAYDDPMGGDPFLGQLDEVRLSSGVRYSADFEPAVSFEQDPTTLVLYHFDSGPTIVDSSSLRNDSVPGASGVAHSDACRP